MANPNHLEIFMKGVSIWNEWRQMNPDVRPDLSGADLTTAQYRDEQRHICADLHNTDLTNADLSNIDLLHCDLSGSDMRGVKLEGTLLRRADLSKCNLSGVDFTKAKTRKVTFSEANLTGANLSGANLHRAHIDKADFSGANLTNVLFDVSDAAGAKFHGANIKGMIIDESYELTSIFAFAEVDGLDQVNAQGRYVVIDYISRAFEEIHKEWPEGYYSPGYLDQVLEKLKILRSIYNNKEVPQQLIDVVQLINNELILYLQKHPAAIFEIKPRQFEELVAELLSHFGWEVNLTPSTKDGGYDIFAISKDISGVQTSWIIECKKYKPELKVGVDIARALYAVKGEHRVANAMLATTSHFTAGVHAFKSSRYDFELRDYEAILSWINEYRPRPESKIYLKENNLIIPDSK